MVVLVGGGVQGGQLPLLSGQEPRHTAAAVADMTPRRLQTAVYTPTPSLPLFRTHI